MEFSRDFVAPGTSEAGRVPSTPGIPPTSRYIYEPGRRVINVPNARLNRILLSNNPVCATLNEYSVATDLEIEELINVLSVPLDDQTLGLEVAGDEVFLRTAPLGRPAREPQADVAPNLWEHLRRSSGLDQAHELWRLYRSLERAGWVPEAHYERIVEGLSRLESFPLLGVYVGARPVPLLVFPTLDALADTDGPLSDYEQAGAAMVGVLCVEAALDETVTAARRWILAHRRFPAYMSILLLEAPRFSPVLLSSSDGAVAARSVTQAALLGYSQPPQV